MRWTAPIYFLGAIINALLVACRLRNPIASREIQAARKFKCQHCQFFTEPRCSVCGCHIGLKAAFIAERCPLFAW